MTSSGKLLYCAWYLVLLVDCRFPPEGTNTVRNLKRLVEVVLTTTFYGFIKHTNLFYLQRDCQSPSLGPWVDWLVGWLVGWPNKYYPNSSSDKTPNASLMNFISFPSYTVSTQLNSIHQKPNVNHQHRLIEKKWRTVLVWFVKQVDGSRLSSQDIFGLINVYPNILCCCHHHQPMAMVNMNLVGRIGLDNSRASNPLRHLPQRRQKRRWHHNP